MIPKKILEEQIIMAIKTVEDPEIPVNIYELGLIYDIDIKDEVIWEGSRVHDVEIEMTLTSPNCPVAESLPEEVRTKVSNLASVYNCKVNNTYSLHIIYYVIIMSLPICHGYSEVALVALIFHPQPYPQTYSWHQSSHM